MIQISARCGQVVGERLGKARRPAYALCVGASSVEVTRFERRGVKVINLEGNRSRTGEIFSEIFDELRNYWRENIVAESQVTEEEPLWELSLPGDSATRLCFFALPLSAHPFYREQVFPLVREAGLVPVTADAVISPGENILAKIEALISRAFLVIVDASSEFTRAETWMAATRDRAGGLLIIIEEGIAIPIDTRRLVDTQRSVDTQRINILQRPDLESVEVEEFLSGLVVWIQRAAKELEPKLSHEAQRLLHAREYRAAVISAITHLEMTLKKQLDLPVRRGRRFVSVREMLENAGDKDLFGRFANHRVLQWLKIRNDVVHRHAPVSGRKAREIVNGVEEIIEEITGSLL